MHAAQGLSYNAEWMRDNWCHLDADPEVCRITQQVAAFDYARIAAEKADAGVPGGVSNPDVLSVALIASCGSGRVGCGWRIRSSRHRM